MSAAMLRRRLRELSEKLSELTDEAESIRSALGDLPRPHRPFSFQPEECRVRVGEIRLERRPDQPLTAPLYWRGVAEQIQALVEEDDDWEHWVRRMEGEESSLSLNDPNRVGAVLVAQSQWLQNAVGPVPEIICPEQLKFDPDFDGAENSTLEEFFHSVFREAS